MEADSTTYDNTKPLNDDCFPFLVSAGNLKLYREFIENNSEKHLEHHIVDKLQSLGLLPDSVPCITKSPDCKVVRKPARVIDKVQWYCKVCKKRQPIRTGSFFMRVQCSLLQTLQIILAWCEDADYAIAAEHFNVKPKVALMIYDKLDDLAVKEQSTYKLGGEGSVVLADLYPDCLNRLSPDTTDQPHVHRILMLADTNHIPTHYQLHVIRGDMKKGDLINSTDDQALKSEIEHTVSVLTSPSSTVITGTSVPSLDGAATMQQLAQHCDLHMQHFLSTRIWRQAVSLCAASRELCAGAAGAGAGAGGAGAGAACAGAVQRYLRAALCRLRLGDGLYQQALALVARDYTDGNGGQHSLTPAV
ncbi:uncharacterized protein LOC106139204 [Amyelois transitella]|uniref:uncharacterized protein LOC106139204 n=1 Tax=Amyelois transitella TaxID=680683 RepID=UPI00298FF853|nr:uncharacterized protein LOC106139204 [Amyelois transitella]